MGMHKKHYKAIAQAISKCTTEDKQYIRRDEFIALLSAELYKDNKLFDKVKFFEACYTVPINKSKQYEFNLIPPFL